MQTPRCFPVGLAVLLSICFAGSVSFTALAGDQRLGMITFRYSLEVTGSGRHWRQTATGDPLKPKAGAEYSDVIGGSSHGEVMYEIVQRYSTVFGRNIIAHTDAVFSRVEQTVSGFETLVTWGTDTQTQTAPYLPSTSFNPDDPGVVFTGTWLDGRFRVVCEKLVMSGPGFDLGDGIDPFDAWPPTSAHQGAYAAWHAEDEAAVFEFAITNPAARWSQTLTNSIVAANHGPATIDEGWNGSAVVDCTLTIEYEPDTATVSFAAGPTEGEAPLTVQFNADRVDSQGKTITAWNWAFGDGTSGSGQSVSHRYDRSGTYGVALLATNSNGVAVRGLGPTNIVVDVPAPAVTNHVGVLKITYDVQVSGSGTLDWNELQYGWEVESDSITITGSGSRQYDVLQEPSRLYLGTLLAHADHAEVSGTGSETQAPMGGSPIHADWTYRSGSTYGLNLSWDGASSYRASYNANWTTDITGDPTAINNAVGAQAAATAMWVTGKDFYLTEALRPWNWTASVTGGTTNNLGPHVVNRSEETLTLTLEYTPDNLTVPFTATPTNGWLPLTVQFSADANDASGNAVTGWKWDLGDGTKASGRTVSHRYTNSGPFLVTLTATNVHGSTLKGTGPRNLFVAKPTVQFTAWPTNGLVPLAVQFSCPAVDSAGNPLVGWAWDFGNRHQSDVRNPAEIYVAKRSKKFSPKLTVTNSLGYALVAKGPKIEAVYPPLGFTASPGSGEIPLRVQFNCTPVDALGVALTSWQWYFGDGGASTNASPTHTYTSAGVFAPVLVARNANGVSLIGFGPEISAGCATLLTLGPSGFDSGSMGQTNRDGIHPQAGLTLGSNRLFGVMSGGGNAGSGTVFAVNPDGSGFTNLHQFSGLPIGWYTNQDGANPKTGLVLSGEHLYGTAAAGGIGGMGSGTVFKLRTDGSAFQKLHDFSIGATNGQGPNGLVLLGSTLFGTTQFGGGHYNGTVFRLNVDGSGFGVIHSFSAGSYDPANWRLTNSDGAYPGAALAVADDVLYGTTTRGGIGYGTVFRINPDGGGFAVLHSFTNSDGSAPLAELLLSGPTIFGTTFEGGAAGNGTVFRLNLDGSGFATLHHFSATAPGPVLGTVTNFDGANPSGGLILSGGVLYGTTRAGGPGGTGTLFRIGNDGAGLTTLYGFTPLVANTNLDGANPYGGLVLSGDTVYTTACNGGRSGNGSIFALTLATAGPELRIRRQGDLVEISWASAAGDWVLQQCEDLGQAGWVSCPFTPADDGMNMTIRIAVPVERQFFRLAK